MMYVLQGIRFGTLFRLKVRQLSYLFLAVILLSNSPFSHAHNKRTCEDVFSSESKAKNQSFKEILAEEKTFYSNVAKQKILLPINNWSKLPFSQKAIQALNSQFVQFKKAFRSSLIFGANFVIPLPVPLIGKKNRLLNKQLSDPDYRLTNDDMKILRNDETEIENFHLRGQFLKRYPWWTFIRQKSKQITVAGLSVVMGLSVSQAYQMERNTVSIQNYVAEAQMTTPSTPKVQILIETTPFPHTAIRIGNKVYSYGTSHMSAITVGEYFSIPITKPNESQTDLKSEGIEVARSLVSRSVRAVDIQLRPEQLYKLRSQLELQTAKRYKNITGINDCATMIARILKENSTIDVPVIVDAYPTTMGSYLTLRHLLGDSKVGETSMIVPNTSLKSTYLVRNTWIAMLEAKAMFSLLPVSISRRVYFETTTDSKDISYYDPKIALQIESWKDQINEEISNQISSYSLNHKQELKELSNESLNQILTDVINPQVEESMQILSSKDAEFEDILLNQEKYNLLIQKKKQILEILTNRK